MATLTLPKKKASAEKADAKKEAAAILREERVMKATEWLLRSYTAFGHVLPLAIGTRQKTTAEKPDSITSNTLALARDRWCQSPRYLAKLAEPGSMRHNLDGSVSGPVSDEHRQRAARLLAAL